MKRYVPREKLGKKARKQLDCILRRSAATDALHQRPPCVGSAATLKWSFEA